MEDQLTLLRETPWDVLIVLDACRADAFKTTALHPQITQIPQSREEQKASGAGQKTRAQTRERNGSPPPVVASASSAESADHSFQVVRSAANCTAGWIAKLGPLFAARHAAYFSANPVVDREIHKRSLDLWLISIWQSHWAHFTPARIPSVHPMSVNGVVLTCMSYGTSPGAIVVHYLQPHSPFIGNVPLGLARWGRGKGDLHVACHALTRPDVAVAEGVVTWAEVREAYLSNLRLVWDAVRQLVSALPDRRIVVTSDHGEMLGEDGGKFGHEANWMYPELFEVPWLELTGHGEAATTRQKLEALGYA